MKTWSKHIITNSWTSVNANIKWHLKHYGNISRPGTITVDSIVSHHISLLFLSTTISFVFFFLPNFSNHHLKSLVSHLLSCPLQVHEAILLTEYHLVPVFNIAWIHVCPLFSAVLLNNKHDTRATHPHSRNLKRESTLHSTKNLIQVTQEHIKIEKIPIARVKIKGSTNRIYKRKSM